MKESTGSSILISEVPGSYGEITAGFSDQKRMQAQGMKLLSKSSALCGAPHKAEQATLGWLVQTGWLSDDASRRNRFH
jgi:hypothetical protein